MIVTFETNKQPVMGIYGTRIYFREGLPKVRDVQAKFKEITGLSVRFTSDLFLRKIMDNGDDIIYQINRSRDEVHFTDSPEFKGNPSEVKKDEPYISTPNFSCSGFDDAYLGDYSVDEKSFDIEYGVRSPNLYFYHALIKTMYELGGLRFRYNIYPTEKDLNIEDYLEPYHPHDREWKKIKKWAEMSDLEKDGFKSRYA